MTRRDLVWLFLGTVLGLGMSLGDYWNTYNAGYYQGWAEGEQREVLRREECCVNQIAACEAIREYMETGAR